MECPLKPLGARVIVKREQLKTLNIIVPDSVKKRNAPNRGVVVAVGPLCEWPIEIGKTYLHGEFAGAWFNAEGKAVPDDKDGEFYVLDEEDLVAEVTNV